MAPQYDLAGLADEKSSSKVNSTRSALGSDSIALTLLRNKEDAGGIL